MIENKILNVKKLADSDSEEDGSLVSVG